MKTKLHDLQPSSALPASPNTGPGIGKNVEMWQDVEQP